MTNPKSVEERKAASAAGAVGNSGVGVDGDDPSVADNAAEDVSPSEAPASSADEVSADPVTGTTNNAVGAQQAQDNEKYEPAS